MSAKTETLTAIIEPVVASFGLQLWGLQYASHNGHSLLRIFIDGEQGVGVDDCAKVSRQLSAVLDVEDPISGKYTLEISSPGLDRPLFNFAQYAGYVGKTIKVKLNIAVQKRKKFRAVLSAINQDKQSIELAVDGELVSIDYVNIDKANVVGELP